MNFKFTSLSVVALATTAALSGCSTEEEKIEKVYPFEQASSTAHGSNATGQGLWCKAPDIVQTVDSDFHPLSTQEITDLKAVALAAANSDNDWTDAEIAAWESSFNPYTYDYGTIDLYDTLGLTNEEMARQAVAKEEARAFKIEQGQQEIFDAEGAFEGGFDAWFDTWFATVPYTDYLGKSQRLDKAARGNELALSTANNGEEACYTPPTECPNYKVLDESGAYDCIVPETNPIADAPAPIYEAAANETVVYFRKKDATSADDYSDITIHAWDNGNCTSYGESTAWGTGKGSAGWDANYGIYWVLPLIDGHSSCGNMIIYNKTSGDKYITQNDGMIPLGNSGDVLLHNLDKITYYQEGFPANLMDGLYLGNQHPYFGAAAGKKSCGWGTELDESGESCVGQTLSCPTGTTDVGVAQVDIASKCIEVFNPDETTLLLRGGFNGWGNPTEGQEFEYLGEGTNKYRKNYVYGAHPEDATVEEDGTINYNFKIADADWSEATSFGGVKGGDLPTVGGSMQLTAGNGVGQDMALKFAENKIYQFNVDATDPTAVQLNIEDVPVAAFPKITFGSEDPVEFEYARSGRYLHTATLAAETVSIVISDEANDFALGAVTGSDVASLDVALALVNDGSAISFTAPEAAAYNITLDLSDLAAPTFKIEKAKPLGLDAVYIRGTMTGWGDPAPDEDEIVYDKDSRTYSVVYGLEAVTGEDKHQFKFASKAWDGSTVDVGAGNVTFSDDAEALPLTGTGNVEVKPTKSTSYEFSLDFSTASVGVLKVQEAPIYIRGGIYGSGDWAADDTMRLNFVPTDEQNTTEAGHVYTSTVTTTGEGFFKIADSEWGDAFGFNWGIDPDEAEAGNNVVVLGTPIQLATGNDSQNISFPHPAGQYVFSFDDVTKQLTVTAAP